MCDYSLHHVKSRPAKVGDKLTTTNFGTGTRGFAAPEDASMAVCVLPGTELVFARPVSCRPRGFLGWKSQTANQRRPSSGKSTRASRIYTMMRWNFLTGRLCS